MITARQSRAARALLSWTQETLADKARISLTALKRLRSARTRCVRDNARSGAQGFGSCRHRPLVHRSGARSVAGR